MRDVTNCGQDVRSLLTEPDIAADVQHGREPRAIAEYGILGIPVLVITDLSDRYGDSIAIADVCVLSLSQREKRCSATQDSGTNPRSSLH